MGNIVPNVYVKFNYHRFTFGCILSDKGLANWKPDNNKNNVGSAWEVGTLFAPKNKKFSCHRETAWRFASFDFSKDFI